MFNLNVYNNVVLYFNNENNKFLQNIKCSILSRSLLTRTPLSATSKIEEETIELNSEAEEKFSQNQIEIQHQKILYNYFFKEIGIITNYNLKKKRKTNEKNESGSEEDSESIEDDEDDEIKKLKEALTKSEENYKILKKEYDLFKKEHDIFKKEHDTFKNSIDTISSPKITELEKTIEKLQQEKNTLKEEAKTQKITAQTEKREKDEQKKCPKYQNNQFNRRTQFIKNHPRKYL